MSRMNRQMISDWIAEICSKQGLEYTNLVSRYQHLYYSRRARIYFGKIKILSGPARGRGAPLGRPGPQEMWIAEMWIALNAGKIWFENELTSVKVTFDLCDPNALADIEKYLAKEQAQLAKLEETYAN